MMVSQALLDFGTVKLDSYNIPKLKPFERSCIMGNGYHYTLETKNGHIYYFFPMGTSVLSVPFVAGLNLFCMSAVTRNGSYDERQDIVMQRIIAAILMGGAASIFFMLAALVIPASWSVIVALVASLGTSILSVASRGLWSHTWSVLLLSIVIYLLLKSKRHNLFPQPVLLATLMAWLYFVRPTNSINIVAITIYLLMYYKKIVLPYLLTGLFWLVGFTAFSWYNFKTLVPDYYLPERLGSNTFWEALAGNLISPARGIFIYFPLLLFIIYLLVRYYRYIFTHSLVWLSASVIILHWIMISTFHHWWGGHSYGPRLQTDLIPRFVLLSVLGIDGMRSCFNKATVSNLDQGALLFKRAGLITCVGFLILTSCFIHYRGAVCVETQLWNVGPKNVDEHPARIWNWRKPQFLAGMLRPSPEDLVGNYIEPKGLPDQVIYGSYFNSGTAWNEKGVTVLDKKGLIIPIRDVHGAKRIEILADHNDFYIVSFYYKGQYKGNINILPEGLPGLQWRNAFIPGTIHKFDEVRIIPVGGDGMYSVAMVVLLR